MAHGPTCNEQARLADRPSRHQASRNSAKLMVILLNTHLNRDHFRILNALDHVRLFAVGVIPW